MASALERLLRQPQVINYGANVQAPDYMGYLSHYEDRRAQEEAQKAQALGNLISGAVGAVAGPFVGPLGAKLSQRMLDSLFESSPIPSTGGGDLFANMPFSRGNPIG